MKEAMLPVVALWHREIVRFVRQRSRLTGAFAQPLVFWLLLGGGFNASFQPAGTPQGTSYVAYFYPGTILMVLLFTAIFATIATVEDRKQGFLQGVLVAPVPRWSVVLGQALGGTTLAVVQGMLFMLLAPLLGISLSVASFLCTTVVMTVIALALTSLGLMIAWKMDSTQGFHAIMNLILLPIWILSGALFPQNGAPGLLHLLMALNPLTYGMAALRRCLYLGNPSAAGAVAPMGLSLLITVLFCAAAFAGAVRVASRPAAAA